MHGEKPNYSFKKVEVENAIFLAISLKKNPKKTNSQRVAPSNFLRKKPGKTFPEKKYWPDEVDIINPKVWFNKSCSNAC